MDSKKEPTENRIRKTLSKIYEEQPAHIKEYLSRYQDNPKSRVFAPLAEAYRKQGRLDAALEICEKGVAEHPEFHGGRVAYARCLTEKKLYEKAKEQLEKVLQRVPENLLAQKLMGEIFLALSEPKQALHHFKMALMLSPEDVQLADKIHHLELSGSSQLPDFEESWEDEKQVSPRQDSVVQWDEKQSTNPKAIEAPALSLSPRLDPPVMPFNEEEAQYGIAKILGFDRDSELEEENFSTPHISEIFSSAKQQEKEITTETLGDLYFSQGQYEKALKIYERIGSSSDPSSIERKKKRCVEALGAHEASETRDKKIKMLEGILNRIQPPPSLET